MWHILKVLLLSDREIEPSWKDTIKVKLGYSSSARGPRVGGRMGQHGYGWEKDYIGCESGQKRSNLGLATFSIVSPINRAASLGKKVIFGTGHFCFFLIYASRTDAPKSPSEGRAREVLGCVATCLPDSFQMNPVFSSISSFWNYKL